MVRLVVVEDFAPLRELLELRLGLLDDLEVVGVAGDGRSALELVDTLHPEVLLLDLTLPDVSGLEVIEVLHQRAPKVAIIVLTGAATVDARQRALDAGAVACLVKTPNAIAAVVDAVRLIADRQAQLPS